MLKTIRCFMLLMAAGLATFTAVASASTHEFYKGKTIRIIAGFPSGGGVDIESRMLARYLPAHIPGNPTILVQKHAWRRRDSRE